MCPNQSPLSDYTGVSSVSPMAAGSRNPSPWSREDTEPTSLPGAASTLGNAPFRTPGPILSTDTPAGSESAQTASLFVGSAPGGQAGETPPPSVSAVGGHPTAGGSVGPGSLPPAATAFESEGMAGSSVPLDSSPRRTVSSFLPTATSAAATAAMWEHDTTRPPERGPGGSFHTEIPSSGKGISTLLALSPSDSGSTSRVPGATSLSQGTQTVASTIPEESEAQTGMPASSVGLTTPPRSQISSTEEAETATAAPSLGASPGPVDAPTAFPVSTGPLGTAMAPGGSPSSRRTLETLWTETSSPFASPSTSQQKGGPPPGLGPSGSTSTRTPVGMTEPRSSAVVSSAPGTTRTPYATEGTSLLASREGFLATTDTQSRPDGTSPSILLAGSVSAGSPRGSESSMHSESSSVSAEMAVGEITLPPGSSTTAFPVDSPSSHGPSVPVISARAETSSQPEPVTVAESAPSPVSGTAPGENAAVPWLSTPAEALSALSTGLNWLWTLPAASPEASSGSSTVALDKVSAVPETEGPSLAASSMVTDTLPPSATSAQHPGHPSPGGGIGSAGSLTSAWSPEPASSDSGTGAASSSPPDVSSSLGVTRAGSGALPMDSQTTDLLSSATAPAYGTSAEATRTVTGGGPPGVLSPGPIPSLGDSITASWKDSAGTGRSSVSPELTLPVVLGTDASTGFTASGGPSSPPPGTELPTMPGTESPSSPLAVVEASSASPLSWGPGASPSPGFSQSTSEDKGGSFPSATKRTSDVSASGPTVSSESVVATSSVPSTEEIGSGSAASLGTRLPLLTGGNRVTGTGAPGSTPEPTSPWRTGPAATPRPGLTFGPARTESTVPVSTGAGSETPSSSSVGSQPIAPDTSIASLPDPLATEATSSASLLSPETGSPGKLHVLSSLSPHSPPVFTPSSSRTSPSSPGMAPFSGSEQNTEASGAFVPVSVATETLWASGPSPSWSTLTADIPGPAGTASGSGPAPSTSSQFTSISESLGASSPPADLTSHEAIATSAASEALGASTSVSTSGQ
ncbi:mucin-5AC-like [Monodelphis domestica]|uniref:mucin-5AC-like n=1 Tax=Monodelphis domestica TaxID=13616 RepID=UPI0024E19D5B|nr:mucin-5AC-like [Monodelphis domestica]